jgi:predicted cation transporter
LVLISRAYGETAGSLVGMLSNDALFFANIVSAVLDNAALVAPEYLVVPRNSRFTVGAEYFLN